MCSWSLFLRILKALKMYMSIYTHLHIHIGGDVLNYYGFYAWGVLLCIF